MSKVIIYYTGIGTEGPNGNCFFTESEFRQLDISDELFAINSEPLDELISMVGAIKLDYDFLQRSHASSASRS